MKHVTILLLTFLGIHSLIAQGISIGSGSPPDSSALLDMQSDSLGLLVPRMTSAQRINIASPATGLLVYDTDLAGFHYYTGTGWLNLQSALVLADSDGDTRVEVEQTPDDDQIHFIANGQEQLVVRDNAQIEVLNSGSSVFLGKDAGASDDLSFNENVFIGEGAGKDNTAGNKNTFVGFQAGYQNVGGNTGINSPGNRNTFVGWKSGYANVAGYDNTFLGYRTGETTTGERNVFLGAYTGRSNTSGIMNTFLGTAAGELSSTGGENVYIGMWTGRSNNGSSNVVIGCSAAFSAGTLNSSVIIGSEAGKINNGTGNVFIGFESGQTENGSNKLYIENSASNDPLIYGEFNNDLVRVNGKLEVGRSGAPSGLTRTLSIMGARSLGGSDFARLDFTNLDNDSAPIDQDLVSARISSRNITEENSGDLRFYTSDAGVLQHQMTISPDGNVGIGTLSPTTHLAIGDDLDLYSTFSNRYLTIGNTSSGTGIALGQNNNNHVRMFFTTGNDLRYDIWDSGNIDIGVLLLNNNGNVGIQNPNLDPSELLSVGDDFGTPLNGNRITIANESGPSGLNIGEDIDNRGWLLWEGDLVSMGVRNAGIQYNSMITLRDGQVGVNTANPTAALHVSGGDVLVDRDGATSDLTRSLSLQGARNASGNDFAQISFDNLDSNNGNSNYTGARISSQNFTATDDGDLRFATYNGSLTTQMIITPGGNVGIGTVGPAWRLEVNGTAAKPGGGMWAATSDARLKQDVSPFTDGLEAIMDVHPVRYRYTRASGYPTDREYVGVIAQELQTVAPYMVDTVTSDDMEYLSVDGSAMIYMLVNAVQDLAEQNQRMQRELATLRTMLGLETTRSTGEPE
ncbi:MAG: tail fiber domain-containing protein [Saprospiraceae bacterium]|nr:tail fiber domain-containing protein [Saprospiraceae bacterium]